MRSMGCMRGGTRGTRGTLGIRGGTPCIRCTRCIVHAVDAWCIECMVHGGGCTVHGTWGTCMVQGVQWQIYIVKFWMCAPPPGVQILSISCSFWEILAKFYVNAPWRVGTPTLGNPGSPLEWMHSI